jgi:hypothetical protein
MTGSARRTGPGPGPFRGYTLGVTGKDVPGESPYAVKVQAPDGPAVAHSRTFLRKDAP